MVNSYFSIVLHAHLPYVRHKDEGKLEERWLFEAISETYIPLIWNLDDQKQRKAWTISFSAPLMEMLTDPLLQQRYLLHLESTEALIDKESELVTKAEEKVLVDFYKDRIGKLKHTFLMWEQNLLNAFRSFAELGKIECICSSATHAFLPYLSSKEGLKAQIIYGLKTFIKHFGYQPKGFWLPECAYTSEIDETLYKAGIQYTFIDEHALKIREPKETNKARGCFISSNGLMLFVRNQSFSSKVWNSLNGYPGDFDYREFYRDIAYERGENYISPFLGLNNIRVDSGLKYHRITGQTENKQVYIRENALKKVNEHSHHFITLLRQSLQNDKKEEEAPQVLVTAFDAELFGHWWFEGPDWLKQVIAEGGKQIDFITPEQFLEQHYNAIKLDERFEVPFHTWGRNGYGEVWLNEKNCWLYREYRRMEEELINYITNEQGKSDLVDRCLKQMVREWMLATSSDWAFIIDAKTASEYAVNRVKEHLQRFEELKTKLLNRDITNDFLINVEMEYPFLRDIFLDVFISKQNYFFSENATQQLANSKRETILMLAWEYPPLIVGGLSRHVYDLSKALVAIGHEVHVVTTSVEGSPYFEKLHGVYVHRVQSLQPYTDEFYHWVGSLNIAFSDYVVKLSQEVNFSIIHAHDWLVCVAAKSLKEILRIPLVATIHATEHGRNSGIHTQLQRDISHKEWELCYEAQKVIVCSDYMKAEVITVFQLPKEKIKVVPNGVDVETISGKKDDNWKKKYGKKTDLFIFSIGRMVQEKGYQTLIDAAPQILAKHRNIKFIIAGKGPLLQQYIKQVKEKNLQNSVYFIGFIDDQLRNQMLCGCDICVFPSYYEPFGIVALEAMIAGKPTIVSDTGGLAEIIEHGQTGLKIIPKSVSSFVAQVINCIEDKQLRKKIAKNGKKLAETQYSWRSLAQETVSVYEDAL